MAVIHSELKGNVIFTNHTIGGKIGNTNHTIEGDVKGEAMKNVPDYTGAYEITPSSSTQTLSVADKRMTQDLVVNPIPSNYGLITWNGSYLTVS